MGDKWDGIDPAGRRPGKVAGRGAEEGKPEGQRLKGVSAKRAREARQYLQEINPSQMGGILTGSSRTLTPQQRAYAYNVAKGATKAEAYRNAYPNAKSHNTINHAPYIAARDPRIQQEIEAYRLAAEAAQYRTASDLRNLVIQALTQQVIDPDTPPAVRTQAIKTLGQVTEVAAFTERRESVIHHSSDKLRAQILEQVTAMLSGKTVEGETVTQDAASLLAELATPADEHTDGPSPSAQDDSTGNAPNAK